MNTTGARFLLPWLTVSSLQHGHDINFVQTVLMRAALEERWSSLAIFVGRHVNRYDLNRFLSWQPSNTGSPGYVFDSTGEFPDNEMLRHNVTDDVLSLLFCRSSEELIWPVLDRRLRRLRSSRLIISLPYERSDSPSAIYTICKRLWKLQFLNVVVLHRGRIYNYSPYPILHYHEITNGSAPIFVKAARNFRGYVVATLAENDLPRIFYVPDKNRTGQFELRGFAYRVFAEFLHRHNAILHLLNAGNYYAVTSNVNMTSMINLIEAEKLEISMHPYTDIRSQQGILSYPLLKSSNCLMVPVRNEIPRYMYLIRPFQLYSWLLLMAALCYLTFALYWLSPMVHGSNWVQRAACSLLEGLSYLLYLPLPSRVRAPRFRYFVVTIQLVGVGFCITNWYAHQLGSFLTAILVGEQVDSFEQLIKQQQRILAKEHEVSKLLHHMPPHLVTQMRRLIVGVNASEQVTAFIGFNRTYAYPFTADRWMFFALQQHYANKPIFRYSSICFGAPVISFLMRKDSHLERPMNDFILDIQSTGLFQYWLTSDFKDALKAGYVRFIDNTVTFKPLDLDTLRLAWFVVFIGWLLAALAFVAEWHSVRRRAHNAENSLKSQFNLIVSN